MGEHLGEPIHDHDTGRSVDLVVAEPASDRSFLMVICIVGAVALLDLAAIAALSIYDKSIPSVMDNTLTGAVTGLVALLAARRA